DVTAALHGVPAVRPAARLWEMLFEHGRLQSTPAVAEEVALELSGWLPMELRDRACRLLVEGKRIAQEAIGTELLSADGSWCNTP
ncbi:MAG TPA: hypothetical protein VM261_04440, partial [Kofleriaceae bacterium]|nr:hypothetical protein [Kofleriaceae bacterium]